VKLERHGNDVQSDDARDAEVEVFAADDDVNNEAWLRIARPIWQLAQPCPDDTQQCQHTRGER